jgi:hypothetical protein
MILIRNDNKIEKPLMEKAISFIRECLLIKHNCSESYIVEAMSENEIFVHSMGGNYYTVEIHESCILIFKNKDYDSMVNNERYKFQLIYIVKDIRR